MSSSALTPRSATKLYFNLLEQIQADYKSCRFSRMLESCRRSLPLLEGFVKSSKKEFGSFDIASIPAIEKLCDISAVLGYEDDLRMARSACQQPEELTGWLNVCDIGERRLALANKIDGHLRGNPGTPQNKIAALLNEPDSKFVSTTIHYMRLVGRIKREKSGSTWALYAATPAAALAKQMGAGLIVALAVAASLVYLFLVKR